MSPDPIGRSELAALSGERKKVPRANRSEHVHYTKLPVSHGLFYLQTNVKGPFFCYEVSLLEDSPVP